MFCFHPVLIASGLALSLSVSMAAANPVIWVGADPLLCDNDNLPTAVAAAPDGAVIRLANDQSYQDLALLIINKSLSLILSPVRHPLKNRGCHIDGAVR